MPGLFYGQEGYWIISLPERARVMPGRVKALFNPETKQAIAIPQNWRQWVWPLTAYHLLILESAAIASFDLLIPFVDVNPELQAYVINDAHSLLRFGFVVLKSLIVVLWTLLIPVLFTSLL